MQLLLVSHFLVQLILQLLKSAVNLVEFLFLDLENGSFFGHYDLHPVELVTQGLRLREHLEERVDSVNPHENEGNGKRTVIRTSLREIRLGDNLLLQHGNQGRVDQITLVLLQQNKQLLGLTQQILLGSTEIVVLLLAERVVGIRLLDDLALLLVPDVVQVQNDQSTHDDLAGQRRVVHRLDLRDVRVSQ